VAQSTQADFSLLANEPALHKTFSLYKLLFATPPALQVSVKIKCDNARTVSGSGHAVHSSYLPGLSFPLSVQKCSIICNSKSSNMF
jgi:hypothetical protein